MGSPDQLRAVLRAMAGTLIDSEPIWIAQQFLLADAHGDTWSQSQGLELVGADMHVIAESLRSAGVAMSAEAIIAALEGGRDGRPRRGCSVAAWGDGVVAGCAMKRLRWQV